MLGFGLRATWFSLSLSGLIACWVTMLHFGRVLGTYWGPVLYCFGCTLMQGIFCLGLIYRMDPFQMPKAFCTAQSIIIGFASFLMSGVAAAFTMATCDVAKRPKTWREGGAAALAWNTKYLWPLAAFPAVASVIQICVTFSQDTGLPTDDLHCDYADPEWLRFLSYAGFPSILAFPCFYYTIRSIRQISRTKQHIQRAQDPPEIVETYTTVPERPRRLNMRLGRMLSSSTYSFSSKNQRQPAKHKRSRSNLPHYPDLSRQNMTSLDTNMTHDDPDKHVQDLESIPDSPVSSSFPTFANPSGMGTVTIDQDRDHRPFRRSTEFDESGLHENPAGIWGVIEGPASTIDIAEVTDPESDTPTKRGDVEWNDESFDKEGSIYKEEVSGDYTETLSTDGGRTTRRESRMIRGSGGIFRRRRPLPTLDTGINKIIVFQFCFTLVQILCTLSTLIDVIGHRHPPAAFGTQHVALLLSAWGPVFIFGILPFFSRTYSYSWT